MRLGSHFRIPPSLVAAGIFGWLVQRQSFVANEWIIGTFEAKCVGYACLLWGLDLALRGGVLLPAALVGASFSFHTAVGLWGGLAVGIAFALTHPCDAPCASPPSRRSSPCRAWSPPSNWLPAGTRSPPSRRGSSCSARCRSTWTRFDSAGGRSR